MLKHDPMPCPMHSGIIFIVMYMYVCFVYCTYLHSYPGTTLNFMVVHLFFFQSHFVNCMNFALGWAVD